jgi:hypothetical protein
MFPSFQRYRRPIGWLLCLAFVGLGLWFLNLFAYHGWAGGGPPTTPELKEWHSIWSIRFFWLALTSFVVGGVCLWRSRKQLAA